MEDLKARFLYCCTLVIMLLCCVNTVRAQSKADDIARIKKLLEEVHTTEDTNTRKAFDLIKQVKVLCSHVHIDTLNAKTYLEEGFCNYYDGNYKRAAMLFDSAAFLYKNVNKTAYFKALNDKATALMNDSQYHKALLIYFECLDLSYSLHDKNLTAKLLNNIGLVYESIEDADNALLYEKKALAYKLALKDSVTLPRTYGNIGDEFALKEMPDSAIYYESISYKLYAAVNDKQGMSNAMGNIGNSYQKKGMLDSALSHLLRAFAISQKLSNAENNANFADDLAEVYLDKHDFPNTWKYLTISDGYVSKITDFDFLKGHYDLMYRYYKQTSNTPQAFKYLEKLNIISDSVFKQKINIQNQKVAFEYEYKQKKLKDSLVFQSELNTTERKAAATKNSFVITFLLLLLACAVAVIWYSRSKLLEKKHVVALQNVTMHEQKIRELENEKQILASQGVLKGQEEERSRLAKDLHDGLGGLLAGVKHSITNVKENTVITGDMMPVFEKSLDMIDTAMKELRRVAQNMMPEALAKFGLDAALNDYCASSCTPTVKVVFQSFGGHLKIDSPVEIVIYRIIQELVHNALKHADASYVMVQLVKGDDWLTLGVEDNGKGFDVDKLKNATGAGWSNIKNRVEYINGNIDIRSQQGMGTSVTIEIKIPTA